MIEMFGIDIGDHGNIGGQFQKGAIRFIRLHHHPVAVPQTGIGAIGIDDAAIDDSGVKFTGIQQGRHQRGRGGLAMRSGNRHALFETHQFSEHFRAPHHRNALLPCGHQFGIIALDGGGHHQDFRALNIGGGLSDKNRDPLVAQPLHIGIVGGIRALHAVAQIMQDLGNA